MITYTIGIPNGPDNPSSDQPNMKTNNDNIANYVAVDHIDFNVNNSGKHKQVQIRGGSLPAGLIAGFETIYAKTGSPGSTGQLFFTQGNAGNEVQLTAAKPAPNPIPNAIPNGVTFLAGGLFLQWGNFDPNVDINVTFPFAFPNNVFSLVLTGSADNNSTFRAGISTGTLLQTGFTFEGTISSHWKPIYWLAIGN